MNTIPGTYAKLNPFTKNSVGENDIWGSNAARFMDVESIHQDATSTLIQDITWVADDHLTRARFLVGAAGTGKSHLFARLRRGLRAGRFTFVANPPTDPAAIKRFILKKVVWGMGKPAMTSDGAMPYSQLQGLVYNLLGRMEQYEGLSVDQVHDAWKAQPRGTYGRVMQEFGEVLGQIPDMDIPVHVRRVLFRVLDRERRDLAAAWLSGSQSLTDEDCTALQVNGPLADEEAPELLKQFGHLSMGGLGAATNDRGGLGLPRTPIRGRSTCGPPANRDGSTQIRSTGNTLCMPASGSADGAGSENESSLLEENSPHSSTGSGPIVLVLDQLDSLVRPEQIHEIESLMIDLKDGSFNWYVIVSLVDEKFDLWHSTVSVPFRERFGEFRNDAVDLAVAEVRSLTPDQKRELLLHRLSAPDLVAERAKYGHKDPYYPLAQEVVRELAESSLSSARSLIQRASHAYTAAVTARTGPDPERLCDLVNRAFFDARAELTDADLAVDTDAVADRIAELLDLVVWEKRSCQIKRTKGPLQSGRTKFGGVDLIYSCADSKVRIVVHDIQRGFPLPGVLKRLLPASLPTILVRDGRVRVSGEVTNRLLQEFRQNKAFFHLTLTEVKNLHALGVVLARAREGDFQDEETEPKPTPENIRQCLNRIPGLSEMDLVRRFLQMADQDTHAERTSTDPMGDSRIPAKPERGESSIGRGTSPSREGQCPQSGTDQGPPKGEVSTDESPAVPRGDTDRTRQASITKEIASIMESERWLAFERLCRRVMQRVKEADPQTIYQCLHNGPLSGRARIHPPGPVLREHLSIVIWETKS